MNNRNIAIDIFRGLTMVFMIFVNNFWTVTNVPHFLEHFAAWEDGIGFSDIIFPMFLFAMGMSVPYALERRKEKGLSTGSTVAHILTRTLALVLMGSFIYNCEMAGYNMHKAVYTLLMVAGFFLVWNNYSEEFKAAKWLRAAGIVLLAVLAITYRSADGAIFRAGWWGILGQIGWMYLFCAMAFILTDGKILPLALCWLAFCCINLTTVPMRSGEFFIGENFVSDCAGALNLGTCYGVVMGLAGMLTTLVERKLGKAKAGIGFAAAAVFVGLGILTHQWWISSKILGSLPWCMFVCAISVALYTVLRLLEKKGWTGWFKPFEPAGKATLTVYMIPYIFVGLWIIVNPTVPAWLTGWVGVAKCALFSALCVLIAWGFLKIGLKLKI